MTTDPIADFLTRIRNAAKAGHRVVEIPASKLKIEMTKILVDQGYMLSYKVAEEAPQDIIKIALKYNSQSKQPAFRGLERASKPGLRQYSNAADMPRVKNGLGVAIVSTSKGLMTDKQARADKIGGEVLCYVY